MIICIGPICVPIWHLGVIALLFLRPLIDFLRRLCGGRAEATEQDRIATPAGADGAGDGASGMHTGALQGGATIHKRRGEKGVIPVKSQEELDKLKAAAEAVGQPLFVDFGATWCGPCRRISPVYERLSHSYSGIFACVDVDECYDLHDLPPSLPTFRVYKAREGMVDSLTGANEEKLKAMVAKHAAPTSSS
ncbi:hypothetical protein ACSSS7_001449 [Eimeria intestinalis]